MIETQSFVRIEAMMNDHTASRGVQAAFLFQRSNFNLLREGFVCRAFVAIVCLMVVNTPHTAQPSIQQPAIVDKQNESSFRASQRKARIEQQLIQARYDLLQPGMTLNEVQAILGLEGDYRIDPNAMRYREMPLWFETEDNSERREFFLFKASDHRYGHRWHWDYGSISIEFQPKLLLNKRIMFRPGPRPWWARLLDPLRELKHRDK